MNLDPPTIPDSPSVEEVVVEVFDAMQARDWERVSELIAPAASFEYAHTGERFDGVGFVAMNRDYPEGWNLTVTTLVAADPLVAANVVVTLGDTTFDCVGLYSVADGQIVSGREWWVDRGQEPPAWRAPYTVLP